MTNPFMRFLSLFVIAALILPLEVMPSGVYAQEQASDKSFSQEELDQLLAPIALYPDSLISEILMASTYPLDVVQASRWADQNKNLKGDALTDALEQKNWDPSIKAMVNFPQVLQMMNEKLDWTEKLGDAFLAQEKDVMDTVQKLRGKAQEQGNLKTTAEQKVVVEKETIIIEPANPQVIYVPTYNPTVIYGPWWYPAYPPYYYYPPGYIAGPGFWFGTGFAMGAAWGYAWGGCNWHGGNVYINVNKNININHNINRTYYQQNLQKKGQVDQNGKGTWKHDPGQRKGVAYRDSATAQKYGQPSARSADARRDMRGYSPSSSQQQPRQQSQRTDKGAMQQGTGKGRDSAFSGASDGGRERMASERGQASRSSMSSGSRGGTRSGGGAARGGRR